MALIFLTSGTTWTVPADWNNASNSIEVIGGGGAGANGGPSPQGGGGAGGGAYSKVSNLTLTPGAILNIVVGLGGIGSSGAGTSGGDTSINDGFTTLLKAKGGSGGQLTSLGAPGGSVGLGIGDVKFSGGGGGDANTSFAGGGGGGGAAGPLGNGGNGGNAASSAGGGGGGNGGGTSGLNGGAFGGNGGNNNSGVGHGTPTTAAFDGGGGNGGPGGAIIEPGSNGIEFDLTHGSGGGSGGGGHINDDTFSPGNYGGASGGSGGASGLPANGAPGIIVIFYETNITTTQTLSSLSRVQITTPKVLTTVAKILATTTTQQTLNGKAAIRNTTLRTLTGVANITFATQRMLSAKASIRGTTARMLSGIANIINTPPVSVKFVTLANLPVNPLQQTVVVIARVADLGKTQSILGCIDCNVDTKTTGYEIRVNTDGSLDFRSQKYNGIRNNLIASYGSGTIFPNIWFAAMLRYSNNKVLGNINNFAGVQNSFISNVDGSGVSNTSSGWILGNQGFTPPHQASSVFTSTLWKSALFKFQPTAQQTIITGDVFWGASAPDANYWGGNTSPDEIIIPLNSPGNPFGGQIAYAIFWNRQITDLDWLQTYSRLKTLLSPRGIVLP